MANNDPKGVDSLIKRIVTRELKTPKDTTQEPVKLLSKDKLQELGPFAILKLYDRLKEDYENKTVREHDYVEGSEHAETSSEFREEKKNLDMVRKELLRRLKKSRLIVI